MRRIKGTTLSGMLVVAVLVVILVIFLMKLAPIYFNHYQVKQTVSALSKVSSDRFSYDMSSNTGQIRRILVNQFYIDDIGYIKPDNILIKPKSHKEFQIIIDYDVKEKMIANISILVHFKIDQEVKINAP